MLCATLYVFVAAHVRSTDAEAVVTASASTATVRATATLTSVKCDGTRNSMPYCSFDTMAIGAIPQVQVGHWLEQYPHAGNVREEGSHANIEFQMLQVIAKLHPDWTVQSINTDDPQGRTVLQGMHDMMCAFATSKEAVTDISQAIGRAIHNMGVQTGAFGRPNEELRAMMGNPQVLPNGRVEARN